MCHQIMEKRSLNSPIENGSAVVAKAIGVSAYEDGTVPIRCSGWPPVVALPGHAALEEDIEADVAVVGAGLAGGSLALHLAERGISVAVLEAGQPGNGASGRNAGHVQPILDTLEPLKAWPGEGRPFLDRFVQHRNIVFDLCRKHGIDADACNSGMIEAAPKKHAALERKVERWRPLGYEVNIVVGDELGRLLGTEAYRYGVHWREGGRVNPYLFTNGMIDTAVRLGARMFGDSPVRACERQGRRWRLATPRGSVLAQQIVVCTNGHGGNSFFPSLARTHYPLVACALATRPLPASLLETINPSGAALTQYPSGLYPLVIDGRQRMITATIPRPGGAMAAETYFDYFLRYLHRTFPQTRDARIELESYWTGMTANSSHVLHHDYPKLYRVAEGVMALMNLGTWGNVMGPLLGMNVAEAIATERPQDLLLPLEEPREVAFPRLFELKTRHVLIPLARMADRLGLA